MWLLILVLWLMAPPVELAAVVGLCVLNDRKKRRIKELEEELRGYRWKESAASGKEEETGRGMPEEKRTEVLVPLQNAAMPGGNTEQEGRNPGWESGRPEQESGNPERESGNPERESEMSGQERRKSEQESGSGMAILALLTGIIFVVLAGLIFATTAWQILPNPAKVLMVTAFSGLFFATSCLAEKRLHIHRTGNALYVLGSIFAFLSVLAAAYFQLLGPEYVLVGQNRWRVLWVGSLVTEALLFLGVKRFRDRTYTQVCFWGMTVSMTFWLLSCGMGEKGEWISAMMIYGWFLMSGKWMLGRWMSGRQVPGQMSEWQVSEQMSEQVPGEWTAGKELPGKKKTEDLSAGELLAEGFSWFAPIHFWGFSFPVVFLGSVCGFFQIESWLSWHLMAAMGAVILGIGMQLSEENCEWKKTFLNVAEAGTIHALAAWISFGISGRGVADGGWTVLAAEMALALWILAGRQIGKRIRCNLWTETGRWIAAAFLLGDMLLLGWQLAWEQMTGGLYGEAVLRGNAFRALAGALILAAVMAGWRKASGLARWGFLFLLWYVVLWPLEVWLRCEITCCLSESWSGLVMEWMNRGMLCFLLLSGMILWEEKKKEGNWWLIPVLGTSMQILYFSTEKVMFPFFLLVSGYLLLETLAGRAGKTVREEGACADKKEIIRNGVWLYRAAAMYGMLGVYLLICPFTRDNKVVRILGEIWVYGIWMAMESKLRGRLSGKKRAQESGRKLLAFLEDRGIFWDVWGCVLTVSMVLVFYENPALQGWNLILCLAVWSGFYGMFYQGRQIWPHLIISLVLVPMPFVLAERYGWTENQMNGIILAVLAFTGIPARCRCRIGERDEGVCGGWRVDWYHVLAGVVLAFMAAGSEKEYWRFALILVLALYFLTYGAIREWKELAWSAAAFMLVLAYWNQPFGELPSEIWTELQLLPAAGYLWSLGRIWRRKALPGERPERAVLGKVLPGEKPERAVSGEFLPGEKPEKALSGEFLSGESLSGVEILQTVGYLLCLLILMVNAWIRGEVVNALLLEGICLAVFVWALVKHCRRWTWMAGTILILVALYMTKDFWLSISWWVYLLAAGIGLIVFAAVNERRKKK